MADPILDSFKLRHLRLKNRIMSTSHEPSYSHEGMPKEQYQLYHEAKAKGGLALSMFGGSACVSPDSPSAFGNLRMNQDEIVPWLQQFSERIHQHDVALMCQLTHLGRRGNGADGPWLPLIAPSPIREPAHRSFPKEMEDFDFKRVVRDFVAAARRCQQGGLDGIEIMASGHLIDCFFSPLTNKRSDDYGGSLANRARLALEVFAAIRASVGDDYIIGTRMVFDEELPDGLQLQESLEITRLIHQEARLDFITVNQGHIDTDAGLANMIPGMGTPAAPFLDTAAKVKREFPDVAIFHAGRIQDIATARHALRENCLDMVGMVRAHMADPEMVNKVKSGDEERIRPCVGAGYCIDRIYVGQQALCIHNAATGREQFMQHSIQRSESPGLRTLVVGAGPAGLEAARILALRGHKVQIFEANSEAGGQVAIAARAPRRAELAGIIDWRVQELRALGIEVQCNSYLEAEDIIAEQPDVVIIATGGLPNTEFITQGSEHALSCWDVLTASSGLNGSVLVYDDNGSHQAYSTAEYLAKGGAQVHLVSPERGLAVDIGGINYPAYLRALYQYEAQITLNHKLESIDKSASGYLVNFSNEYSQRQLQLSCDHIVVEHGTLALADVYFDLKPQSINLGEIDHQALILGAQQQVRNNERGLFQLYRLGDAQCCGNIHSAIYDAARICQNL